jgi:hypothetical protein
VRARGHFVKRDQVKNYLFLFGRQGGDRKGRDAEIAVTFVQPAKI